MRKWIPMSVLAASLAFSLGCLAKAGVEKTIPQGTILRLEMADAVSSADSKQGDTFEANVVEDVVVGGQVAIPAGSAVSGRVAAARGLKAIGGRALLRLELTAVETPYGEVPMHASWSRLGKSETKKDAAIIGGSAAGGAILGRMMNDRNEAKGTLVGGLIGAGAGTAIAAGTKGDEIHLPAGSHLTVRLQTPVTTKVPS